MTAARPCDIRPYARVLANIVMLGVAAVLRIEHEALLALCERYRSEALAMLPFLAAEIADATSFGTLLQLCDRYGGTAVHLPEKPSERSAIAQVIGPAALMALTDRIGGGLIDMPARNGLASALRPLIVRHLARAGATNADIARKLGITARTVARAKARAAHIPLRKGRS